MRGCAYSNRKLSAGNTAIDLAEIYALSCDVTLKLGKFTHEPWWYN